jgi:hypothetical protein
VFRKASKRVSTGTGVVPPDTLSPTSSTSSAMSISEDTEQDLDDPEPTSKGNV